jgi:arylsulfatase A-like enzyme
MSIMQKRLVTILFTLAMTLVASCAVQAASEPNIVIILTDDQGYADISFNPHHPKEVSTPHMDALAKEGVFFTQGYTSGVVCSPTRAGLMLGRYQQRVGVYTAGEGGSGFDPKRPLFPSFFPKSYQTTAIGKWHLGLDNDYPALKWHALSRGFDECYKFMGRGAHDYFKLKGTSDQNDSHPIYRNKKRIDDEGYLTHRLTEEAVAFIDRNKNQPFLLYLAYNAVHSPKQAPKKDVERFQKQFPGITKDRAILMAMLHHLDNGVGAVTKKLKDENIWNNTLLFFLTDNGGSKAMQANNTPLRAFKGSVYEGGIRTPFVVSWPDQVKGGRQINTPVISLDILPTALDATGQSMPTTNPFDGKSLLPLLRGKTDRLHENLFWSTGSLGQWAVRSGDWKLVSVKGKQELFNLAKDQSEQKNLVSSSPNQVKKLTALYEDWIGKMGKPISGAPKKWSTETQAAARDRAANKRDREKQKEHRKQKNSTTESKKPGDSDHKPEAELTEREKKREQIREQRRKERHDERNKKKSPPSSSSTPSSAVLPTQNTNAIVKPMNVLFIVCDDLNTHVKPAGFGHIQTPALDKLAAAGLTFRRAYCQYPVCGPSRASFLSGLYPESTGIVDNKSDLRTVRPGTLSMPEHFKKSGYWTAGVGKIFHGNMDPGNPAWHDVQKFQNDELPIVTKARKAFEAKHGLVTERKNRKPWKDLVSKLAKQTRGQTSPGYGPSGLTDSQHKDGKNAQQVIKWLNDKAFGDKPFFITCGIQKPHVPFLAPQKYFDAYPTQQLKYKLPPTNDWNDIPPLAKVKRYQGFGFEFGKENDSLRHEYTQAYHACISFIDAQIGLVLEKLKERGLWENTIVIFTSDHGYHLGEHFMWGKVTLFEECARVPMIIRVPKTPGSDVNNSFATKAGTTTQGLVELLDVFPTLVELCNLEKPKHLQGQSIVNLFSNPKAEGKQAVYTVVSRGPQLGRSIRTPRWRYAEWANPGQAELYDLSQDPNEYTNLAKRPKHRDTVKKMHALLAKTKARASSQLRKK